MLKDGYEKHHKIEIPAELLPLIVKLTAEHMPRRHQPDKSIIVMDGACASHVIKQGRGGALTPEDVKYMVSIECKLHPDAL